MRDLTSAIKTTVRRSANMIASSITHPLEETIIDYDSGKVIAHREPSPADNYGIIHHVKLSYVIVRESLLHPNTACVIDRKTLEVKYEK